MKKVEEKVISTVERLKDELISTTRELIRIPTINPPGENYEECVCYLSDVLNQAGLKVQVVQVPKAKLDEFAPLGNGLPRLNLLAELSGNSEKKALHFNGHYDVVPATDNWKVPPFKAVVKDGRIYGRGSSDMKGAIASMVIAAKALVESDVDLNGLLQISAVPDEETDGLGGSSFIIKEGKVKADYCIIGEPSGVNNIWNAHKGTLWMQIETIGRAAHGSQPWLGINAFEEMVQIVNAVHKELKPVLAKKISAYPTIPPQGQVATINIGGFVQTGKAVNIVPDRCLLSIDRRLIPEENLDEAKKEIRDILRKLQRKDPSLKPKIRTLSQFNACLTPADSLVCTTTTKTVEEITGKKPTTTMCIGGLDMRYFVDAGIPSVAYGPGDLRLAHTVNEHVEIKELVTAAKVYALVAMKLLGTTDSF